MNIDYFFPVFQDDDAKKYFTNFFKSKFYKDVSTTLKEEKTNKTDKDKKEAEVKEVDKKTEQPKKTETNVNRFYFVVYEQDKQNLEYLSKEALLHPEYKILVLNKTFSYNDAFAIALKHFKGDVVLLGDTKVAKIDLVFEKCMQKLEKCSVVHVVKRTNGFKGFFKNLFIKSYNFFIKLFTGKKDRFNVTSLGLIDKHVVSLLQVLPNKCCFLKNTKNLKWFESRSIYIDSKTKTYKNNFKQMSGNLITVISSLSIIGVLLLSTILLNSFLILPATVNIVLILLMFSSFIVSLLFFPKHIFDIRNKESKNLDINVKEIN
ncbi:MAG: hypothetical protein IJD48_03965 [Clostridia bacterium]|nr:hypothetical protein [Clostridia bacterium]